MRMRLVLFHSRCTPATVRAVEVITAVLHLERFARPVENEIACVTFRLLCKISQRL
jgi:hypothetical protein